MASRRVITSFLCSLVLLPCAIAPLAAHADSAPELAISVQPITSKGKPTTGPAYFVVRRKAGHSAHLHARLTYHGLGRATFALVPVDAKRNAAGAVMYNLPGAPRKRVAAWVRLSRTKVTIAAGKSARVDVTLTVPRSVKTGQYIGALTVFIPVSGTSKGNIGALRIQPRLAVAILVTVPAGR